MSNIPTLSIIVPVYNVESYLPMCLDSILAQDFTDYEVIMVDDGSTDASGAICDRYASDDPRFQCIHKTNGGLPSARKCGFDACRGEYAAFVDSDDWIAPDMYGKMYQAVRDTHADIVLCNYTAVMSEREEVCNMPFAAGFYDKAGLERDVYPYMLYSGIFYKYGISPNLWNKMFRRELLRSHLMHVPNDVSVGEDALASYSCILDASSAYVIDEALYYYRSNADSMSRRAMPATRLIENHKLFQTLHDVIDVSAYPCMEKQMDYYFVYQCLLTFIPVFENMTHLSRDSKQTFRGECSFPLIRKAFARVPVRDIAGTHNKLYALCIRYRLYALFSLLLKH